MIDPIQERCAMRRHAEDQRGSIPLALLVVIVMGGLTAAITATTVGGTRAARFDSSYTTAIQGADAGVQQAALQIQSLPANSSTTSLTSTGTQTIGGVEYQWTATRPSASSLEWTVDAVGRSNTEVDTGASRRVLATVRDQPRFFLAAYADQQLTFRGSNTADSYSSDTGAWFTGNGIIGTNGDIQLNGASTGVDQVHLYNWDNYKGTVTGTRTTRCRHQGGTNCDDPVKIGPRLDIGDITETQFIRDALEACEDALAAGDSLSTWVASANGGVMPAGVRCYDSVIFDVDTTIGGSGDAIIYVRNAVSVRNSATVNCSGCVAGTSAPDAGKLQLYVDQGPVLVGNHTRVAAAVYAPTSECKGNPSNAQSHIFGSMICRTLNNQGGWSFSFDDSLRSIGVGRYEVGEWSEERPVG
jgi:hypothetical protein